ncbi:MAG: class I SAM-dependent methyltransferase [Alphaproteobacteria bacterium]|nr:class I SAM-dependent methyltransferase [Alphaproteobacteria bacterium]
MTTPSSSTSPSSNTAPSWQETEDGRVFAPATARNRDAILAVLTEWCRPGSSVLEIASGTGEHAVHFTHHLDNVTWQPSDPEPRHRVSIAAWAAHGRNDAARKSPIPLAPLDLDVTAAAWPLTGPVDAMLCCNLTHIAPWPVTKGLMAGAARTLVDGGALWLYGPFLRDGKATSEGDARFHATLQGKDPAFGLRDLDAVLAEAARHGLAHDETRAMPANNLFIRFLRA